MKKSVMKKVLSFVLLVLFLSVSSIVLAIPSEPPVSDPNGPYTGNVGFPVWDPLILKAFLLLTTGTMGMGVLLPLEWVQPQPTRMQHQGHTR